MKRFSEEEVDRRACKMIAEVCIDLGVPGVLDEVLEREFGSKEKA